MVQVIAAAVQNVDSVPEPDEALAKLKHSRAQTASAQTSSPAPVPAVTSAAPVPSVGNKANGTDAADGGKTTPAGNASSPGVTGECATPVPQSSNGSAAVTEVAAALPELSQTGAAKSAAMPPAMQPKAGVLQPKQLPMLASALQKSGGLFRPTGLSHQQDPANSSASLPQQPAPDVPPAGAASAEAAQPAEPPAAASLRAADTAQQHDSSAAVGQLFLQQEGATVKPQQQPLRAQATGLRALLGCSRTPRSGAGMAMLGMPSGAPRSGLSTNKVCSRATR